MRIDEYLALYGEYRRTVMNMGKTMELIKAGESDDGGTRFIKNCAPCREGRDSIDILERQYRRKKRVLDKATKRINLALADISDGEAVRYIVYKYFYLYTNERLAEIMNYSLRQLYRLGRRAKDALYERLLLDMPTAKRTKGRKYRLKRGLKKRRYRKYAYANKVKKA